MLRTMKDLEGCAIQATDATIGHVTDFYFDDKSWVIRYLVVDTGSWLSSRKILISPIAIGHPNWSEKLLPVSITKEQVKNSPDIDTKKPVSRQHEMQYLGYYGYPFYWDGIGLWGGGIYPNMMMSGYSGLMAPPQLSSPEEMEDYARDEVSRHKGDDPHLRSYKAVMDYHIQAADGDIGHVQGILFDEETWAIRYFIVNTSNWWLGHLVLIAPQWIQQVSWLDSTVSVDLTRQSVKDAPAYDASIQLSREQEVNIFKYYGHPGYWEDEIKFEAEKPHH
jgi:hypothetical protein